jgi:glycosyltransferase involved in cell wall biosynthesis
VFVRRGFDVIQACNPPDTYFALALLYRPLGVRFVFDHHDLCPELFDARFPDRRLLGRAVRLLEMLTFRTAHHVIETNESHREIATGRGRRLERDVTIVRSGPDLTRLRRVADQPALRRGRPHLCCYVGIMGHQDGVDTIVRAAQVIVHEMGREDIHFALMGFGDCFEELRALTTELDLDEHITFTGKVGNDELAAHLSSGTVGLSPDPKTDFNEHCTMNKTLEYLAFSLPVVTFDLRENVFSAGDAGLIVTTPGPTSFAKAIVELVDDPDRRRRMGAIGRARVEGDLAWDRQASTYVHTYERLLSTIPVAAATSAATRAQS